MQPSDPAVDALLTAGTLVEEFRAVELRLTASLAEDVNDAIADAERLYPAIWEHLDAARAHLAARGIRVHSYDVLRAYQPEDLRGIDSVSRRSVVHSYLLFRFRGLRKATKGMKSAKANRDGLADAVFAMVALRGTLPHVPWKEIRVANAVASSELGRDLARSRRRRLAFGLVAVAAAIALGVGLVRLLAVTPEAAKPARKSFSEEVADLRARLQTDPCEATSAEQLVTKLRINGRLREAREVGHSFLSRCGDNAYISSRVGYPRAE
jgi:hypothetical protein